MTEFPPIDPRTIKSEFDVWTSKEMIFNNPSPKGSGGQNLKTYPRFTKAKKVKYDKVRMRYLNDMEKRGNLAGVVCGRAVAIEMDGIVRYVWREDVYTEDEFKEAQKTHKAGLRMLRSKPKGNVDQKPTDG